VHAGIDWDWEMPAVTLWLFALGGAAMAAPARELGRRPRPRTRTLRRAPGLRATVALASLLLALPASLLAQSETRLLRAQEAFRDRDCLRAAVAARDSLSAVGTRPEPYEILGLCAMRFGFERRGVERLEQAVRRDPRDWRFRYGLALARGGAGLDPRPAAAAALRLNPLQPLAREAVRRFATDDPRAWRRAAREASLRGELDD